MLTDQSRLIKEKCWQTGRGWQRRNVDRHGQVDKGEMLKEMGRLTRETFWQTWAGWHRRNVDRHWQVDKGEMLTGSGRLTEMLVDPDRLAFLSWQRPILQRVMLWSGWEILAAWQVWEDCLPVSLGSMMPLISQTSNQSTQIQSWPSEAPAGLDGTELGCIYSELKVTLRLLFKLQANVFKYKLSCRGG